MEAGQKYRKKWSDCIQEDMIGTLKILEYGIQLDTKEQYQYCVVMYNVMCCVCNVCNWPLYYIWIGEAHSIRKLKKKKC